MGLCRSVQTYFNSGKAEKKERIVLERDSGPRLEARKEEKGKKKVAKVTPEFVGLVGKLDTSRQTASRRGDLEQESERCGRRQRRHQ